MFSFDWPWLWLLLPLPLLSYFYLPAAPEASAALKVSQGLYGSLSSSQVVSRCSLAKGIWLCCIWLLLLGAAARPQWLGEPVAAERSGRDLLLAVDISGSMETADMQLAGERVDRLSAIKAVLDGFIKRRPDDRIGLILFGSNAYIQAPLTYDHATVASFLADAQIGFAGTDTAIGDAIALAVKRLTDQPADSRVLVLLTDGANTAGVIEPVEAAKVAAEQQIKLYTLGFGADEQIVRDFFGSRKVNPSRDLDEATLQQLAQLTDGRYFRARDVEQLKAIYQQLDLLEPSSQDSPMVRPTQQLFHWPLAVALLISALWAGLSLLRARRKRLQVAS